MDVKVPRLSLKRLPIPRSISSFRLTQDSQSGRHKKSLSHRPTPHPSSIVHNSTSSFRSPALHTKLSLLSHHPTLRSPSRWQHTEAVFHLLQQLASEDGVYHDEMQTIVHHLRMDLFLPTNSLPEHIQNTIRNSHIEAYGSQMTPLYAVIEAWELQAAALHQQIADLSLDFDAQKRNFLAQIQQKDAQISNLQSQIDSLSRKPQSEIDLLADLSTQMQKITSESSQIKQLLQQTQYNLESTSEELQLKMDLLRITSEDLSKTRKKLMELEEKTEEMEGKTEKRKEKYRKLKLFCAESIGKWKIAAKKANELENRLKITENEAISLRERAASGFTELTPRPNWSLAGIPSENRSSSSCFSELLHLLNTFRAKTQLTKHKTRKTVMLAEEKRLFSPDIGEEKSEKV